MEEDCDPVCLQSAECPRCSWGRCEKCYQDLEECDGHGDEAKDGSDES